MNRPTSLLPFTLLVSTLLLPASGAFAQDTYTARIDANGQLHLLHGETELALVQLNAHGTGWKHAPQSTATAAVTPLPGGPGRQAVGTLPIPTASGGALRFTVTFRPVPQGLQVGYDVGLTAAMKLNGLQVSIDLPVARYGGKDLAVTRPEADPSSLTLPAEKNENGQLYSGEGAKVEIAGGTPEALVFALQAPADVAVQDLRKWEQEIYEVRFPAIYEDGGRDVGADDRFHLDLTVTLAGPVKLVGPGE